MQVPKIIYTYWHDQAPPPIPNACLRRIQRLHPAWKFVMLSDAHVPSYVLPLGRAHRTRFVVADTHTQQF